VKGQTRPPVYLRAHKFNGNGIAQTHRKKILHLLCSVQYPNDAQGENVLKWCPTTSEFALANLDLEVESRFLRYVVLANGCSKLTSPHRMDDLNVLVSPYIKRLTNRPLEVLDIAVSSGISTQEWYEQMSAEGIEVRVVGTDLYLNALHIPGKVLDLLLDKDLNVIHLGILGAGVHPHAVKLLRSIGLNALVRIIVKSGASVQPIRLLSAAVKNISVVEEGIDNSVGENTGQCDVIRAANILNLAYFPEDRLRSMIRSLSQRLRTGGLFIVCRTHDDGTNHASVFRLEGNCLAVLDRLGNGSEIEHLTSSIV
jgi:hypothetical protein